MNEIFCRCDINASDSSLLPKTVAKLYVMEYPTMFNGVSYFIQHIHKSEFAVEN